MFGPQVPGAVSDRQARPNRPARLALALDFVLRAKQIRVPSKTAVLDDLVVMARVTHPIPSRTRP